MFVLVNHGVQDDEDGAHGLCQISLSIIVLLVVLCESISVVTLHLLMSNQGVAQDDGCVAADGHFHYQVQCDAFHVHEGEE